MDTIKDEMLLALRAELAATQARLAAVEAALDEAVRAAVDARVAAIRARVEALKTTWAMVPTGDGGSAKADFCAMADVLAAIGGAS